MVARPDTGRSRHHDLQEAAKHFGTNHDIFTSQITRLEKAAGTKLLITNHAGVLQWTRHRKPFIFHIRRALETIGRYTP